MTQGNGHEPKISTQQEPIDVSIVVPLLNEEENVQELYRQIKAVMDEQPKPWEVIIIDDGSHDRSAQLLREVAGDDPRVTLIQFSRTFGQTAGMSAGFRHARGRVIVPMDGDLQNDPADIPRLVAKLDEGDGWDIVSGWRKNRQDKWLSRKLPSRIANWLVRRMTWTNELKDFGCTLKAYRRTVLDDVRLYGEMHRFLPAICKWRGARVTQEVVNHRPRLAGESKYGLKRTIKVMLDLVTVKFIGDYLTKPIYFFGKLAMGSMLISFLAVALAIVQKYGYITEHGLPVNLNDNVLVLFAMMMFLMSVMFIMLGVMSEMLVRIYHESQDRDPYKIIRMFRGQETLVELEGARPITRTQVNQPTTTEA